MQIYVWPSTLRTIFLINGGLVKNAVSLAIIGLGMFGCGPKAVDNIDAPVQENVIFPIEYAGEALTWRTDSHQVVIGFTDELNQSEKDNKKYTVNSFCQRISEARSSRTVHIVWSGEVNSGIPTGTPPVDDLNENPFGAANCTGGTTKAIDPGAQDLDLSTLPVTKALEGSALVEYMTDTPDTDTEVTVIIKTATADGQTVYTRKLKQGLATKTVADTVNADIPADASVDVPTPSINNLTPRAVFSQKEGNPGRIQLNFLGLVDPTTGATVELIANQTIFLADGDSRSQKGLKITQGASNSLPVDILFAIDNSGSMGEEADKVAEKIKEFSQKLVERGVDAKFAVVGFNGGITGAIDFTDVAGIETFLNRDKGIKRTGGFSGGNAAILEEKAGSFKL
jgi:hypothetical protein